MRVFILFLGIILFVSCGYKPSSHYIKNVFSDKVFVSVEIDSVEPENAPFIKDEMNRLIYTRFSARVVSKAEATSEIYLNYKGSSYYPLAYSNGYVTRYRVNIRVDFTMKTKDGKILKKVISSSVESDIQASSLSSSSLRVEALRKGLAKALEEFLAFVSAEGVRIEEKKHK
jgi:hypothetical protein